MVAFGLGHDTSLGFGHTLMGYVWECERTRDWHKSREIRRIKE